MKRKTNLFQPSRIFDLFSRLVGDVENIRHLIDVGRYLCHVDRQTELVQRVGDRKQDADPIFRENFQDGEIVRRLVIHLDDRRHFRHMALQE